MLRHISPNFVNLPCKRAEPQLPWRCLQVHAYNVHGLILSWNKILVYRITPTSKWFTVNWKDSGQVFLLRHSPTQCFGQWALAATPTASDQKHAVVEPGGCDPEHTVCQRLNPKANLQVRQGLRQVFLYTTERMGVWYEKNGHIMVNNGKHPSTITFKWYSNL